MCLFPSCFIINTSEVGVLERFGKYAGLQQAGLGCVCWPITSLAGRLSFRVQQLNVRVETKTLDNVFCKLASVFCVSMCRRSLTRRLLASTQ